MRFVLLVTAIMNMFGAMLFLPFITFFRDFYGFPAAVHPLYLWIIAAWIFLFGACYFWLGINGGRERLFLFIAATGKLTFVVVMFVYWLKDEIPLMAALASLADLFFAIIFAAWLWQNRND